MTTTTKTARAELGSISSGTARAEDLLDAFARELKRLCGDNPDNLKLIAEADEIDPDSEGAFEIVINLLDALNNYAPAYCYFGAHPGDAADYGFWPQEDFQQLFREDDGLEVGDLSEVPAEYAGLVLRVNDHGNATLYTADKGELTEIWSIV